MCLPRSRFLPSAVQIQAPRDHCSRAAANSSLKKHIHWGRRTMASATLTFPSSDVESFKDYVEKSDRILALLGAGLSASSGLPTFRGAGGIWRNNEATALATPQAFQRDPGLVWQFYSYRRHMALAAQPNKAHYALAELSKKKPNFITLSQNVDGKVANAM